MSTPMSRTLLSWSARLGIGLVGLMGLAGLAADEKADAQVGQSFRVPYRLTDTNHYLVRVRINGKGPFNFLVDSGAPALYVGTEAAKAAGLVPPEDDYWTPIERLDLEGGVRLANVKGRVEDPFQLVGMNALGLPGASIDGILGFTILARFRLEFDPTDDRMTWTRIDHDPREPFIPRSMRNRRGPEPPAEVKAMSALGPLMKLAAVFVGKQPEEQLEPRGSLGIAFGPGDGDPGIPVAAVLEGSPAARVGIQPGDRLLSLGDHPLHEAVDAHVAAADLAPGETVELMLRRGADTLSLTLTLADGF